MPKGKAPALMLYTGDWIKDTELSLCSPATRGIWIDWLCRLRERMVAGRPPVLKGSVMALSRLARCSEPEAMEALRELGETETAVVTMSRDVTVGHSNVTVDVLVENRRMTREYRAKVGATQRQRRSRENRSQKSLPEACHENVTPPLSVASSDATRRERGKEPSPTPSGLRPEGPEDGREISIPPVLSELGLTPELLADRIATKGGRSKGSTAWAMELKLLAGLVPVHGSLVVEVFKMAISGEWVTCTPQIVEERAAKLAQGNGGRPACAETEPARIADVGRGDLKKSRRISVELCEKLGATTRNVWKGDPGWDEGEPFDDWYGPVRNPRPEGWVEGDGD